MQKPDVVIVMEGGIIHNILCDDNRLRVVVIDYDCDDVDPDDEHYCEELEAYVADPYDGTSTPDMLEDDYLLAIARHLGWETDDATIGATPPQDSQ